MPKVTLINNIEARRQFVGVEVGGLCHRAPHFATSRCRGEGNSGASATVIARSFHPRILPIPPTTTPPTATMATSVEQSAFFQQQLARGEPVVRGNAQPATPELR
jgi:hypothetical protein